MSRLNQISVILFCTGSILFSCNTTKHNERGVEAAMNQYNHYIQKMDLDSIALLFTSDGDLGNVAHGRNSIKFF